MCGITGWINKSGIDEHVFIQMRDSLIHRGPDDAGTYINEAKNIALGHRRLSFLDLSDLGKQPMCNEFGDIWIVLNGEIYNYLELKIELQKAGHIFKSTSDTEVLIHGYEEWGIDNLLKRIKGMFAFALLDEKKKLQFLVRDRFGIKPLYYFSDNHNFIFASELKAIVKSGVVKKAVNFSAFADFFVYRYIPSPKTIWKDVFKIPPANYLKLNIADGSYELNEYWKLIFDDALINPKVLADEVNHLLHQSIIEHSRSDVEIGSFLSGGYDSSAIVYYLSKIRPHLKTFSIGFENWDNSEEIFAKIVADKFGAHHTSLIAGSESLDAIRRLNTVYDEPIADISIIPTYLVSQLAAKNVKAVMSGEGADELFGGYQWQKEYFAKWHPDKFSKKIKKIFCNRSSNAVNEYAHYMSMGRFNNDNLPSLINSDFHKHTESDSDWFYRKNYRPELSPLKSFQFMDIKCFMGELVLTKVDRASMAHSLEVRVPFLDHEIYERVFKFNEIVYFKPTVTKFLLYEGIKEKLPQTILHRKKQGFVGPDSYYMNMEWYRKIITEGTLLKNGIINKGYVDALLEAKDHWRLWKIAVMENWWGKWIDD